MHTPGPWDCIASFDVGDDWGFFVNKTGSNESIPCFQEHGPEAIANAKLIAAAPDLLAACKLIEIRLKEGDGTQKLNITIGDLTAILSAIDKAEGTSELYIQFAGRAKRPE